MNKGGSEENNEIEEEDVAMHKEMTKSEVKRLFMNKLMETSTELEKTGGKRLLIILDSIDQLSPNDHDPNEWMIFDYLPQNIKIIYSLLPDYPSTQDSILLKIKQNVEFTKNNYLRIDELDNKQSKEMLKIWLENGNRELTDFQWRSVDEILDKTSSIYPLHVKILFDIVSKWASYERVDEEFQGGCTSTKDTIKYLFNKYDRLYGHLLFSHCIFYLTLFEYNGISESELEDILSIDDEVLTEVFQHHHPPVRRFQMALWLKIKYEIKAYLTNKETDGVQVISWFHRSFIEASQEYYPNLFTRSKEKDNLLLNVIDYFTERWNGVKNAGGKEGQPKSFKYDKRDNLNYKEIKHYLSCKFNKTSKEDEYEAFRLTKSQKIKSGGIFNKRKLNELLNVIMMLSDDGVKVDLLKRHVYLDYRFMHAKCELKDLDFIIEIDAKIIEMRDKLGNDDDPELNELIEVSQMYNLIYPYIKSNPDLLYIELLIRLESRSEYVKSFMEYNNIALLNHAFIKKEQVRDFFVTNDYETTIETFYSQHKSPFIFIHMRKGNASSLQVVNSLNSKSFEPLQLGRWVSYSSIQIITNKQDKVNKLSDLNPVVYFHSTQSKSIFCYDYSSNTVNPIYESNQLKGEFKQLLLLSSNCLLVVTSRSMMSWTINELDQSMREKENNKNESIVRKEFEYKNDEIEMIRSTIPEGIVFSKGLFE